MSVPDRYLLLLGSNVDPAANLARAEEAVAARFPVLARSRAVEGPAVGDAGGPPFRNRALLVGADLDPASLRAVLRGIEARLGRVRGPDRNAPRTVDADILLALDAAGAVLADPPLHRDLLRHHYAALPAAEIAGSLRLPDGRTLDQAAAALGPPAAGFRILEAP
jgi:2-amino-4-hydroxy-6-hydroxymethyldihydropteridine diphosphokinase